MDTTKLKLLQSPRARKGAKAAVVLLCLVWCGSDPMGGVSPVRTTPASVAKAELETAIGLARARRADEAAAMFRKLIGPERDVARRTVIHGWLAWCAQIQGHTEEQLAAAEAGLAEVPHEPGLVSSLASALATRRGPGDLERARQVLEAALTTTGPRPDMTSRAPNLYRMLATVKFLAGDRNGARAALEAMQKSAPKLADARLGEEPTAYR